MRSLHDGIESLKIAISAIRANKARGILTTLGIIIGIVAVVTTMTAANGLGNSFKESIAEVGSDVFYVSRMPWIINGNFFEYRNRPNLTLKQSDALSQAIKNAGAVNPSTSTRRKLKYRSNILENIPVIGTTDQQVRVSRSVPEIGRFFTQNDVKTKKKLESAAYQKAEILYDQKRYAEAVSKFKAIIDQPGEKSESRMYWTYFYLGNSYKALGEYEKAEEAYDKAEDTDSDRLLEKIEHERQQLP